MKKDNDKNKNKKKIKTLLNVMYRLILLILIGVMIFIIYKIQKEVNSEENKLTYTQLLNEIQNGNVEKIEMTVGSTNLKVKIKDVEKEKIAIIPSTQVFMELVQAKVLENNNIELETKTPSFWSQLPSYTI